MSAAAREPSPEDVCVPAGPPLHIGDATKLPWHCATCRIDSHNANQLRTHILGRKHRSAILKALGAESAAADAWADAPPTADAILVQLADKSATVIQQLTGAMPTHGPADVVPVAQLARELGATVSGDGITLAGAFAPKQPRKDREVPAAPAPQRAEQWSVKLLVEYDGTAYFGWQRQPEGFPTVQSALESAIQRLTGDHPDQQCVRVAGRTDRVRRRRRRLLPLPLPLLLCLFRRHRHRRRCAVPARVPCVD